jgi:hypothetical protein
MVYAVISINAPSGALCGIKETLAMYCERFGDCKVVSITEKLPEQLEMEAIGNESKTKGENRSLL